MDQEIKKEFENLASMIKERFDESASKEDLKRMVTKEEFEDFRKEIRKEIAEIRFELKQLSQEVREFVSIVKKQEVELIDLKIKYKELEERIARLEAVK